MHKRLSFSIVIHLRFINAINYKNAITWVELQATLPENFMAIEWLRCYRNGKKEIKSKFDLGISLKWKNIVNRIRIQTSILFSNFEIGYSIPKQWYQ